MYKPAVAPDYVTARGEYPPRRPSRGFSSKSEFVRHALRAAVGPIELSEETRAILAETEGELERGETVAHEGLKRELGLE